MLTLIIFIPNFFSFIYTILKNTFFIGLLKYALSFLFGGKIHLKHDFLFTNQFVYKVLMFLKKKNNQVGFIF